MESKKMVQAKRVIPRWASAAGLGVLLCFVNSGQKASAQDAPAVATTSPLSILQQAPRVRFDETPQSAAPPLMQAPPPYSGATTARPPQVDDRDAEEIEESQEKKPGRVRGIIRAIPFIGKRIAGEGEVEPAEEVESEERPSSTGKRPARVPDPPPGSGRDIPSYTIPAAPPQSTDRLYPVESTPSIGVQGSVPESPSMSVTEPAESAPMLSIKPERPLGDLRTTSPAAAAPTRAPAIRKEPALATETTAAAVLESAGVQHDQTADGLVAAPAIPSAPAVAAAQTSPTLEPNDLGMPNPAYEQNDIIRAEYTDAVKVGRAGNYAEAARMFRDYAENHPSSGLAPRASFLAAVLEPDPTRAAEAHRLLKERFASSRYVRELEKRTAGKEPAQLSPTPDPDEPPAQAAIRLENELTQAVGNREREVPLRLRLGQIYMSLEEYERALEVMRPARELAAGLAEEPEILVLISECMIATRRTEQAATLLSEMIQKFPNVPQRPRAQYDLGLVSEASGNYARARAIYTEVQRQWPETAEGQQALQRLKDLAALSE